MNIQHEMTPAARSGFNAFLERHALCGLDAADFDRFYRKAMRIIDWQISCGCTQCTWILPPEDSKDNAPHRYTLEAKHLIGPEDDPKAEDLRAIKLSYEELQAERDQLAARLDQIGDQEKRLRFMENRAADFEADNINLRKSLKSAADTSESDAEELAALRFERDSLDAQLRATDEMRASLDRKVVELHNQIGEMRDNYSALPPIPAGELFDFVNSWSDEITDPAAPPVDEVAGELSESSTEERESANLDQVIGEIWDQPVPKFDYQVFGNLDMPDPDLFAADTPHEFAFNFEAVGASAIDGPQSQRRAAWHYRTRPAGSGDSDQWVECGVAFHSKQAAIAHAEKQSAAGFDGKEYEFYKVWLFFLK